MDWIEVITHTTTAGSEAVSDAMISLGAAGTQVEDRADVPDPSKPHGYWEIIDPDMIEKMPADVLVHAWYQPDAAFPEKLSALRARLEVGNDPGNKRNDVARTEQQREIARGH